MTTKTLPIMGHQLFLDHKNGLMMNNERLLRKFWECLERFNMASCYEFDENKIEIICLPKTCYLVVRTRMRGHPWEKNIIGF